MLQADFEVETILLPLLNYLSCSSTNLAHVKPLEMKLLPVVVHQQAAYEMAIRKSVMNLSHPTEPHLEQMNWMQKTDPPLEKINRMMNLLLQMWLLPLQADFEI